MPAPVEPAARATSLLTVRAGRSAWAIPSSAITVVERLTAGSETDAPDALRLLGMDDAESAAARRVVVLRASGELARVLVCGSITLTEAAPGDLLPLPEELAASAPLVSHIALMAGKPALFVVSPERLLRASREIGTGPPLNDEEDAARGASC